MDRSSDDIETDRNIVKYASQLGTVLGGYIPMEIYEIVPIGGNNILSGYDFLKYLTEAGLDIKTIEEEKSLGSREHEGTYEVEGYPIKVHRGGLIRSDNYLGFPDMIPEELVFRISKIVSKGIVEDEVKEHNGEFYRKFLVKLEEVDTLEELQRLVSGK